MGIFILNARNVSRCETLRSLMPPNKWWEPRSRVSEDVVNQSWRDRVNFTFRPHRIMNRARDSRMEVTFCRTGERQYAVTINRPGQPALEMNPAPGYDARMPHDLIHFVVERELGLRHGIFGQLADGGTAGTFHPAGCAAAPRREAARQRRALARRGAKLLRQGRADSALSERAADLCRRAWLARAAGGEIGAADALPCSARELARICTLLDELSRAWARLGVGESLTLDWPTLLASRGR